MEEALLLVMQVCKACFMLVKLLNVPKVCVLVSCAFLSLLYMVLGLSVPL